MAGLKQLCVTYLRSSKDRADVSIDAQRRQLGELAAARGLTLVKEYADVVESAKSEYRPAFQELVADLRRAGRPWQVILMLDHSRLSRQPYVGHVFRYECARYNVEVVFSMFPELDPISRIILDSTLDAMAVVHSIMSRQKGLSGMAENISRGWRAGGRAPKGYRLKLIETGAVRDGAPVTKSVLEPSDDAPLVACYLKGRAGGLPRAPLVRDHSIPWPSTTLIGLEWNALTYAGHTVWNRHNEMKSEGGYVDGRKMRPREEWQIQRDTHKALITDAEAETILARLSESSIGAAVSRARRGSSAHLLTGVLEAPDGRLWEGQARHYRVKAGNGLPGRYVGKGAIDAAVIGQVIRDFRDDNFIGRVVENAQSPASTARDQAISVKHLRAQLVDLNAKIARAMDLVLEMTDPAPALRKVEELEARRQGLVQEIAQAEQERAIEEAHRTATPAQMRSLIEGLAVQLAHAETTRIKGILRDAVQRVVLDPATMACRIFYSMAMPRSLNLASPRGFEPLLPP